MPSKWSTHAISPDSDYRRAGIIPFCFKNNVLWFCLGVDRRFGELTDFGGGIKKRETPLEGAARELFEESSGMFNECLFERPEINTLQSTICISQGEMTLIFLPVSYKYMSTEKEDISDEISSIVWLTKEELLDSINNQKWDVAKGQFMRCKYKIWKKLVCFLRRNMKEFLNITNKLNEFYWND